MAEHPGNQSDPEYHSLNRDSAIIEKRNLGKAVVVFEDVYSYLDEIDALNQLGNYRLLRAKDTTQFFGYIKDENPDLIICDIGSQSFDAYKICFEVREQLNDVKLPILAVIPKSSDINITGTIGRVFNDFIVKPFDAQEFRNRISINLELSNLKAAYDRFVPSEFLHFLEKRSILDVDIGDHVEQSMSILFSDICSFTTMSEQMSPKDNFNFLNSYLAAMEPVVRQNNGFIDKYIGDAIMALFSEESGHAVDAAISMLHALKVYNSSREQSGLEAIRIGIGVNTGTMMLGTVGGSKRMEGTVISDAVNLASRIEHMTRAYELSILIGEETFLSLEDPNKYCLRIIDHAKPKGKTESVTVFEVFDADEPEVRTAKSETKTIFERAVMLCQQNEYAAALPLFTECFDANPADSAARIYVDRCRKFG